MRHRVREAWSRPGLSRPTASFSDFRGRGASVHGYRGAALSTCRTLFSRLLPRRDRIPWNIGGIWLFVSTGHAGGDGVDCLGTNSGEEPASPTAAELAPCH